MISIGQWGVFNHEKGAIYSPIWQLKKRELLLPLSFLIIKPLKLDLSNLHYGPHYEAQGCVIRENSITALIRNPIKDPIKDTLVPLRTNFNANGSVRWRTSLYLNLFHWPMGKNSGNGNGVCRYVRAQPTFENFLYFTIQSKMIGKHKSVQISTFS